MGARLNALLNVFGLVIVLTVNALANILPINGYNTGQISGFYPNFFVPAGFNLWYLGNHLFFAYRVCFLQSFCSFWKIQCDSQNSHR